MVGSLVNGELVCSPFPYMGPWVPVGWFYVIPVGFVPNFNLKFDMGAIYMFKKYTKLDPQKKFEYRSKT